MILNGFYRGRMGEFGLVHLAQCKNRRTGLCEQCKEPSGSVRYGKLRDCQRNYQPMNFVPQSYFGTLREFRLYLFLYNSSKHRWHESVLSSCWVFCVILRQKQASILHSDGVYFVRDWIFIMTRKVTGHCTAISLLNLGRPVHSAQWHTLFVVDLNYVLWIVVYFVLHRRDAVVVRMKDVFFQRRSGVAADHLGLSGRSREITVRMYKVAAT